MVSSKTVVILALSRYIIRNYSEATQNWTEASALLPWHTNITLIIRFFLSEFCKLRIISITFHQNKMA